MNKEVNIEVCNPSNGLTEDTKAKYKELYSSVFNEERQWNEAMLELCDTEGRGKKEEDLWWYVQINLAVFDMEMGSLDSTAAAAYGRWLQSTSSDIKSQYTGDLQTKRRRLVCELMDEAGAYWKSYDEKVAQKKPPPTFYHTHGRRKYVLSWLVNELYAIDHIGGQIRAFNATLLACVAMAWNKLHTNIVGRATGSNWRIATHRIFTSVLDASQDTPMPFALRAQEPRGSDAADMEGRILTLRTDILNALKSLLGKKNVTSGHLTAMEQRQVVDEARMYRLIVTDCAQEDAERIVANMTMHRAEHGNIWNNVRAGDYKTVSTAVSRDHLYALAMDQWSEYSLPKWPENRRLYTLLYGNAQGIDVIKRACKYTDKEEAIPLDIVLDLEKALEVLSHSYDPDPLYHKGEHTFGPGNAENAMADDAKTKMTANMQCGIDDVSAVIPSNNVVWNVTFCDSFRNYWLGVATKWKVGMGTKLIADNAPSMFDAETKLRLVFKLGTATKVRDIPMNRSAREVFFALTTDESIRKTHDGYPCIFALKWDKKIGIQTVPAPTTTAAVAPLNSTIVLLQTVKRGEGYPMNGTTNEEDKRMRATPNKVLLSSSYNDPFPTVEETDSKMPDTQTRSVQATKYWEFQLGTDFALQTSDGSSLTYGGYATQISNADRMGVESQNHYHGNAIEDVFQNRTRPLHVIPEAEEDDDLMALLDRQFETERGAEQKAVSRTTAQPIRLAGILAGYNAGKTDTHTKITGYGVILYEKDATSKLALVSQFIIGTKPDDGNSYREKRLEDRLFNALQYHPMYQKLNSREYNGINTTTDILQPIVQWPYVRYRKDQTKRSHQMRAKDVEEHFTQNIAKHGRNVHVRGRFLRRASDHRNVSRATRKKRAKQLGLSIQARLMQFIQKGDEMNSEESHPKRARTEVVLPTVTDRESTQRKQVQDNQRIAKHDRQRNADLENAHNVWYADAKNSVGPDGWLTRMYDEYQLRVKYLGAMRRQMSVVLADQGTKISEGAKYTDIKFLLIGTENLQPYTGYVHEYAIPTNPFENFSFPQLDPDTKESVRRSVEELVSNVRDCERELLQWFTYIDERIGMYGMIFLLASTFRISVELGEEEMPRIVLHLSTIREVAHDTGKQIIDVEVRQAVANLSRYFTEVTELAQAAITYTRIRPFNFTGAFKKYAWLMEQCKDGNQFLHPKGNLYLYACHQLEIQIQAEESKDIGWVANAQSFDWSTADTPKEINALTEEDILEGIEFSRTQSRGYEHELMIYTITFSLEEPQIAKDKTAPVYEIEWTPNTESHDPVNLRHLQPAQPLGVGDERYYQRRPSAESPHQQQRESNYPGVDDDAYREIMHTADMAESKRTQRDNEAADQQARVTEKDIFS